MGFSSRTETFGKKDTDERFMRSFKKFKKIFLQLPIKQWQLERLIAHIRSEVQEIADDCF